MFFMARLVFKKCRLAIQVCVGYFPDGRERRRTFSLAGIKEDAGAEALASVVRALAPLLACPIRLVRIVRVYELVPERVGEWDGSGQGSRFTARASDVARASMSRNVSPGIPAGQLPASFIRDPDIRFWGSAPCPPEVARSAAFGLLSE
jgi:hypothetical protein